MFMFYLGGVQETIYCFGEHENLLVQKQVSTCSSSSLPDSVVKNAPLPASRTGFPRSSPSWLSMASTAKRRRRRVFPEATGPNLAVGRRPRPVDVENDVVCNGQRGRHELGSDSQTSHGFVPRSQLPTKSGLSHRKPQFN